MQSPKFTKDENGQYFFEGRRMLVSHIRGGMIDQVNPRFLVKMQNGIISRNPYEPELIRVWYEGPVGTVVAIHNNDEIRYGFSKTNFSAGDIYNRNIAIKVALNRALFDNVLPPFDNYRDEIKDELQKMYRRSRNYFKHLNPK